MASSTRSTNDINNASELAEGPDVTVAVGTGDKRTEFDEQSRELCCWSDYFHAAFRSGMAETRSRRFEFPHRDPEEWKFITSLVKPFASVRITLENLDVALSWFDELLCKDGLKECDRIMKAHVLSIVHPEKETTRDVDAMKENLDDFMQTLSKSIQFGLEETKQTSCSIIMRVFDQAPGSFKEEHIKILIDALVKCDHEDDCATIFWDPLFRYLPASLENANKDDLLRNECLPALILAQIQMNLARHRQRRLLELGDRCSDGRYFRRRVRGDTLLQDVAPEEWNDAGNA